MQVALCRHIKTNGIQCHAVALKDSVFCYFHHKLSHGHALYRSTLVGKRSLLERGHIVALPALEDRLSVQLAISEVVNALACNFIDAKRANSLLFGLKLAVFNAKGLETIATPTQVVREFAPAPDILDSIAVDIAPKGRTCEIEEPAAPAEVAQPPEPAAPVKVLLLTEVAEVSEPIAEPAAAPPPVPSLTLCASAASEPATSHLEPTSNLEPCTSNLASTQSPPASAPAPANESPRSRSNTPIPPSQIPACNCYASVSGRTRQTCRKTSSPKRRQTRRSPPPTQPPVAETCPTEA
jgi:hypothetical protein